MTKYVRAVAKICLTTRAKGIDPDLEQAEVEEMPSRWLHHQNWFLAEEAN